MQLSEDEIIQKTANVAGIVFEILYFHWNTILLAFHLDIT